MSFEEQVANNKVVWTETRKLADHYKTEKAIKLNIIDIKRPDATAECEQTRKTVKVFKNTILEVTEAAVEQKFKPLIVNMASENNPLPGVVSGVDGPEGDLIRRSNLHISLDKDLYPLHNGYILYSPVVTIFKDSRFKRISKPMTVSVLSIPSVRRPSLITMQSEKPGGKPEETYSNSKEEEAMKMKIEAIFHVAQIYNHHTVIVNDFGISEMNPERHIVKFFKAAMEKYPVKYVFFAVSKKTYPAFSVLRM
jgi:uncharacterized protein (TIGR02452 family)